MRGKIMSKIGKYIVAALFCILSGSAGPAEEILVETAPLVGEALLAQNAPGAKVMSSKSNRAAKAASTTGIVIEGESIRAKASRGEVFVQDESSQGKGLSGGKQLVWSAPGEGALLTLSPDVASGLYEVTLFMTLGPDRARIEALGSEGVIPKSDVELFAPEASVVAQVSLGRLILGPDRGFALRILGKDPRATAFSVGLDRIGLNVVGPEAEAKMPSPGTAIEAESLLLRAKSSAGSAGVQDMRSFGKQWSGGAQLLWRAPAPVEAPIRSWPNLTLPLEVAKDGRYSVTLFFTVAPDYGNVRVFLRGKEAADFRGHAPAVDLRSQPLGEHELKAGSNQLVFTVFGKETASIGYLVGIDRISVQPAGIRGRPQE